MAEQKSERIAAGLKLLKKYQKNKEHTPETKSPQRTTPVQEDEQPEPMPPVSLPPVRTFFDNPPHHYQVPEPSSGPASTFFNIPPSDQNNFFDSLSQAVGSQSVPYNAFPPVATPSAPDPGRLSELENENSQLFESLGVERKNNFELQCQIKRAEEHIANLLDNEMRGSSGSSQNLEKMAQMEEKIVLQAQSIEILVSEKTDLQQRIERLEEDNKSKTAQCEDMAGRVRTFRSHVAQLEREVADHQEARQQHNTILKKLETSVQERNGEISSLRENLAEKDMEIVEIRRRLDAAFGEISELQKELEEKESRLSLAQIKMQQLGSGESADIGADLPSEELKKEIKTLKGTFEDLKQEKDRSAHQYQTYINDLNGQLQDVQGKYEACLMDVDALKAREESLVGHISDLEKRIQSQPPPPPISEVSDSQFLSVQNEELKKEIDDLKERLDSKSIELEKVHEELGVTRLQGRALEERLEEAQSNCPDAKLLQAAMESDKVAASRALAQNTSLKDKLTEMQQEFIRLSNNKLEIMEQLEKEQSCTAQLRDEVVRLRKTSVTEDRSTQQGHGVVVDGCTQTTYHDMGAMSPTDPVSPEAVILLQEKFTRTMDELAELSDEKARLEHQVMQLQGETETIGEYIALYQRQRSLLQKRASEKDQQVALLSQEREELRNKLAELGALVPQLVANGDPEMNGGDEGVPEKTEAARKIQTLWKEIGSSSLVKEAPDTPTLAPCPLCSGRLITV